MPELNPVEVRFRAQLRELKETFDEAANQADRSASRVSRAFQKVGETARRALGRAQIAAAAAGAALAFFTKRSLESVDAQAKMAARLGLTTSALAGLQLAAAQTGVGVSAINMGLQRMTRRVAEAGRGTGEAKDAIRELGLDAAALARLAPDEQFARIADALNRVGSQSDRVRLAFKLFDSEGVALVNTAKLGAAGLADMERAAREVGFALGAVDVAQITQANDAANLAKTALQGVGNTIAAEVAPLLRQMSLGFFESAREAGGFRQQVQDALDAGVTGTGVLLDGLRGLQVLLKTAQLAAQGLGTAMLSVASTVHEGWTRLLELILTGLREAIVLANRMPGVNIPVTGLDRIIGGLHEAADGQIALRERIAASTRQTAAELHEVLMRPLPSEALRQWVEEARKAGKDAAEALAAAGLPGGGTGGTPGLDSAAQQKLDEDLKSLRERLASELELEDARYEESQQLLQKALANRRVTEDEHRRLTKKLEEEHQEQLFQIRQQGLDAVQRLTEAAMAGQVNTVLDGLVQITAGLSRENKKAFEANKTFAIAQALVNAYQGISKTLATYPFPLSAIMAAAQAGLAFAQVNAIRSQSFGRGGGAAPSLAGTTPATPTTPVGGPTTLIRLEGQSFPRSSVEDLLNQLNEGRRDGGRVVVVGGG